MSKEDKVLTMQIEWVTGGICKSGMHEMVGDDRKLNAINVANGQNHRLWESPQR